MRTSAFLRTTALPRQVLVFFWSLYVMAVDISFVCGLWTPSVATKAVLGTGVVCFIDIVMMHLSFGARCVGLVLRRTTKPAR